jgi:mannose-6-phosphate isomerase
MIQLYPFLLAPQFVERVWGARDLAPLYQYSRKPEEVPVGEVWLTGDECQVVNGPLAGYDIATLAGRFGCDFVGEAAPRSSRFPLLIKFLFPCEKLSVQVHPDDEGARRHGHPNGKTECWYVHSAAPGAQIGLGLKPGATLAELERAIAETRAEELLNWIDLAAGELVYVDAGTVHTIGPGSVLVEVQQNSDLTYRLYDYGRPRPLHLREAFDVIKEKNFSGKIVPSGTNGNMNLVTAPWFVVNKRVLAEGKEHLITRHMPPYAVQIVVGLEGGGWVLAQDREPVAFSRGQVVVVPATLNNFRVRPQKNLEYLHVTLPQDEVKVPQSLPSDQK